MTTIVMIWIAVGLLAGWLATFAVNEGGRGLVWDLGLGVAGSSVAGLIVWSFTASGNMSAFAIVLVALSGAVISIVAQRAGWSAPMIVRRPLRSVTKSRR